MTFCGYSLKEGDDSDNILSLNPKKWDFNVKSK